MLNPDNSYLEEIFTASTGKACFEGGTLVSDAAAMTNTVLVSTCNAANVNHVATYTYVLSSPSTTVTVTETTAGSSNSVNVWAKQAAVQTSIIGTWGNASSSALSYVTCESGCICGNGSGGSASYEFKPDGTYKKRFLLVLQRIFYLTRDLNFFFLWDRYAM